MTHHLIIFVILSCLACLTLATTKVQDITGRLHNITIPRGHHFTHSNEMANTEIVLSPGNRKTSPDRDGRFIFHDLPAGSYRIDVYSLNNYFEPVYVEVNSNGAIEGYYANQQAKRRDYLNHPFEITARGNLPYFEIEEEFNILNMAKSGYGIMIGVMILMMFCAKNMPSMDEMEDANRAPDQGVEDQPQTQNQPLPRSERRR